MNMSGFVNEVLSGFGNSCDVCVRHSENGGGFAFDVLYISNYCSKDTVSGSILLPLVLSGGEITEDTLPTMLASLPLEKVCAPSAAANKLLSGGAVIVSEKDGRCFAYAADAKNEDGRSISEPDSEVALRGPRQGFVESAETNVVMLRKIIRSERLRVESMTVGSVTKTGIRIVYVEGLADGNILAELKRRIESFKPSSCIDSGYLEHYLQRKRMNFFPEVGNSEKPDKVAAKLMGGRIAVICDGSPVVLTVPYLFIESIQSGEDYLKTPYYTTFIRLLRILGMLIAVFLPALYTALMDFHAGGLPYSLYAGIRDSRTRIPFDVFTELLVILLIFEIIREVGIRMPRAVGNAVSIVGGLILGDAAIKAGIASAPVIMAASLTAICNFMNPPHMDSNVIIRLGTLVLSHLFGFFGLCTAFFLLLVLLCGKKSFGVPYMAPLSPFSRGFFRDGVIQRPMAALEQEENELKNG